VHHHQHSRTTTAGRATTPEMVQYTALGPHTALAPHTALGPHTALAPHTALGHLQKGQVTRSSRPACSRQSRASACSYCANTFAGRMRSSSRRGNSPLQPSWACARVDRAAQVGGCGAGAVRVRCGCGAGAVCGRVVSGGLRSVGVIVGGPNTCARERAPLP
jgi:hypothetical protein